MDNIQFGSVIEDIFNTIGKFTHGGVEKSAIRRDILNRLNQSIPVNFIEQLSDLLNERGYEGDDTSIGLADFRSVFTEWMESINSDDMNRSMSSMDSESFPRIQDRLFLFLKIFFKLNQKPNFTVKQLGQFQLGRRVCRFCQAHASSATGLKKELSIKLICNIARAKRQFWRRRDQRARIAGLALGLGVWWAGLVWDIFR